MASVKDLKKRGEEYCCQKLSVSNSVSLRNSVSIAVHYSCYSYTWKKKETKDRDRMRLFVSNNCSLLAFPPLGLWQYILK